MYDARKVPENGQEDVDHEVGMASSFKENTNRRKEDCYQR
jgi:hypothetical protein